MKRYSESDMCGRYARKSAQELLAEWFDLDLNLMPWFTASYNAAPQSFQPVVWLDTESSQRRISLMRWGFGSILGQGRADWPGHHQRTR